MKKYLYFLMLIYFLHPMPVQALELRAFGDVTFGDSSGALKGKASEHNNRVSSFTLGQLDLWGTHVIDNKEKMRTFIELVIESSGSAHLERLWAEYAVMPELKIRGGRFHTSTGYWNRVHHHGAHMQTTVSRPLFLDFEDDDFGVLPTHTIGLMSALTFGTRIGKFHIELQYGNGTFYNDDTNKLDTGSTGDIDDGKAIAVRTTFNPKSAYDMGIGFSYINNPVKIYTDTDKKPNEFEYFPLVNQTIYEADLFYLENNVEFMVEYYWINNQDAQLDKIKAFNRVSTAWYAQFGYTFIEAWTPYARYEFFDDVDPDDPYFSLMKGGAGITKYKQAVYGVRFDINSNSSLKIEGRSLSEDPDGPAEENSASWWAQWTFLF